MKNNTIENIAKYFLRTDYAIRCRIKLLSLNLDKNKKVMLDDIYNLLSIINTKLDLI